MSQVRKFQVNPTMASPHASAPLHPIPRGREVYCNRTLNLRAIKAIGYDMDYTLIHYKVDAWEQRAYAHLKQKLKDAGWPVADLEYQPALAMRGLVIDTALGNIVKADRFGYIRLASHGTRRLAFDEQRRIYSRELVELGEPRWLFLNTFFSLSEACMYAQLVDRFDAHRFGDDRRLRRPVAPGAPRARRGARRGPAEGGDRRRPRSLRGGRPGGGPGAARPEGRRQDACCS